MERFHYFSIIIVVPKHFQWLPCEPPNLSNVNEDISRNIEGQQILLLWGMDNKGDPINDSWILNVNTMTWKQVNCVSLHSLSVCLS